MVAYCVRGPRKYSTGTKAALEVGLHSFRDTAVQPQNITTIITKKLRVKNDCLFSAWWSGHLSPTCLLLSIKPNRFMLVERMHVQSRIHATDRPKEAICVENRGR